MNKKEVIETIVYRDDNYPSMWIDDRAKYPDRIAQYLQNKGLEIKKAEDLRKFMIKSIETNTSNKKFVVFSQDIIPDSVAEDYYSNTTLREFLDQGGSILWIGDIPAFYLGKEQKKLDEEAGHRGAPIFMLGVVPIFAHSVKQAVSITTLGKKLGLKRSWSGIRPVLPDIGIEPLAKSEIIFGQPYMINIFSRDTAERFRKPIEEKGLEAGIPQILKFRFLEKDEIEARKVEANLLYIHKMFPNAWFKNYNDAYPESGFYRIWDFSPRNLNDWMLEELYIVIKSIEERLMKRAK
ncbi:MAG: hypothetical protein QXN53_08115 [Thermoproteota archaeon]